MTQIAVGGGLCSLRHYDTMHTKIDKWLTPYFCTILFLSNKIRFLNFNLVLIVVLDNFCHNLFFCSLFDYHLSLILKFMQCLSIYFSTKTTKVWRGLVFFCFLKFHSLKILLLHSYFSFRDAFRTTWTSKMELFVKIVYGC